MTTEYLAGPASPYLMNVHGILAVSMAKLLSPLVAG